VTKINNQGTITVADVTKLVVNEYDPVTLAMNDLGSKIDALPGIPVSGEGQAAFPPIGMVMDANRVAWSFGARLAGGGRDFIIKRNGVQFLYLVY
jgi:hypothetical protein